MSLYISPKITLVKLNQRDIAVVSNACTRYYQDLQALLEKENRAQQYIHISILQAFRYELLKRLTNRFQAKTSNIKIESFTAFVVYDALQHYSNHCDNPLEQAILRRIITQLFRDLPTVSDKTLSIHSQLNFQDEA